MGSRSMTSLDLSPLDRIRLAEAENARLIALARQNADRNVLKAKAQARSIIEQAREEGKIDGEKLYREIIAEAEKIAQEIRMKARLQADEMSRDGESRVDIAVKYIISIVTDSVDQGA